MNHLNSENRKWIPLKEVMLFFNYRSTQMSALLKDKTLIVAKVGKRKFVFAESVDKFLEKSARD
jgi:hypothetical protein